MKQSQIKDEIIELFNQLKQEISDFFKEIDGTISEENKAIILKIYDKLIYEKAKTEKIYQFYLADDAGRLKEQGPTTLFYVDKTNITTYSYGWSQMATENNKKLYIEFLISGETIEVCQNNCLNFNSFFRILTIKKTSKYTWNESIKKFPTFDDLEDVNLLELKKEKKDWPILFFGTNNTQVKDKFHEPITEINSKIDGNIAFYYTVQNQPKCKFVNDICLGN